MTTNSLAESLAAAVAALDPSVVTVHGRRGYSLSGVVLSDTTVITTNRAVQREEDISVVAADGGHLTAELVGRDPSTDLTLLRVEAQLQPATWEPSDSLAVGAPIVRLARPHGLRATFGIVSAAEGSWRTEAGGQLDAYLTSDAVSPRGFSGGPLATLSGSVIGVTTRAFRDEAITVPTETVRRVADTLLEHGRIPRGYLGLAGQPVRIPKELWEGAGSRRGLMVVSVQAGSPASEAGLALGDTLISFAGSPVTHTGSLLAALDSDAIGQELAVRYLRGGTIEATSVTVGERPTR